jgi:hypothetical protein
MKLWSSVRQQAGKLAFEAERMVRIKKEESAIDDSRKQIAAVQTSLGQVALSLFRSGSLNVPQVAALAQQIAELEVTIKQHEDAIVAIRAEQSPLVEGEQPVAAAAPYATPAQAPLAPMASAQPYEQAAQGVGAPVPEAPAVEARKCANCGAALPEKGAFCQECGAKIA